jgi:elongator complex protein 2
MIASGCQDNFIRIWKIDTSRALHPGSKNKNDSVSLESVIGGHEDKIYCVKWVNSGKSGNDRLQLLSTSIDRSAIIWEQPDDIKSNIWFEKYRFGEISGNNLGFLSGAVSPNGLYLIINSYNGALHAWTQNQSNQWQREVVMGGHLGEVNDLVWSVDGSYLMSCGADSSTRIHCEWNRTGSWHEITRSQVHGYEVNCLAPLSPFLFASGADEKMIRVFETTKYFLQCYENVTGRKFADREASEASLAEYATIPLLGLSNKAIYDLNDQAEQEIVRPDIQGPPIEEALLQHTCWSEHAKLYGHGYELFALAADHRNRLIASACKATNSTDAAICIWDRKSNFDLIARLPYHRLTVTKLTFSPDDSLLLSVSRDRSWQLFRIEITDDDQVLIHSSTDQPTVSRTLHSRVIRDACWTPDSRHFVTASRDQSAICWQVQRSIATEGASCIVTDLAQRFKASDAINCCDISKHEMTTDRHLVAFGLENGDLLLTMLDVQSGWSVLHQINRLHTLAVKRVVFSPIREDQIATGGADGFVQVLTIK